MKLPFSNAIPSACRKLAVWAVAAAFFYSVVGFLILPPIAREVAAKDLSKRLDRPVTIRTVVLNPFSLSASIRGLLIRDKGGAVLASCEETYFNFQLASLVSRSWVFQEVRLSQPFLRVQVNKDYTLNFSDLVARLAPLSRSKQSDKVRPWRIARLRVAGGRLSFADLTPRLPFQTTVGQLELSVTNFQTGPSHKNAFAISGVSDAGEQFSWNGYFNLAPLRSEGRISAAGFALTTYAPLYQDLFRFVIKDGVARLDSAYRYTGSAGTNLLILTNTTFQLKSLEMVEKDTGRPVVQVANLLVTGISLDALARRAEADSVSVTGGQFVLRRNKDTSVNAVELLKPADAAPAAPGGVLILLRAMTNLVALLLNTTNLANGTIRDLKLTNCALHLEDLVNSKPVRLELKDISVRATNISNRIGTNMTAVASLSWETNGAVRAGFKAGLAPADVQVTLALDKLNLLPLAPYLEPYLDVFALGSKVGLAGTVRLRGTTNGLPQVSFAGDAWLDGFSLAEGAPSEGLLQWNSLRLSGVEANLNPPVVSVTKATLSDVFARLTIETNRTINLMSALHRGGTNAGSASQATNRSAAVQPRISVASFILSNANVHFLDRSLHPNVNIVLERLNGTLSRISSDDPQPAEVHLEGTIDQTARAEITGKVNPWDSKRPLDLHVSLQEMDLLPEDPYASKYLGYRLKRGKLSVQLRYQVAERKLTSENRLTLDQLTLGQKVESADATSLPVRLAIALLKDRDGRIVLEVPVNGSLDDPQFSKVAHRAIEAVLTRIVTSPFSALGALFGGKGEELSFLQFEPGSTNLPPAAFAKLDRLAKGLYARPELLLQIEGSADAVTDLEALRREKVHQQMPAQEPNTLENQVPAALNSAAETASVRSSGKAVSLEKGAAGLRSPVAYWSPLTIQSKTRDDSLSHLARTFADDKGATALMQVFAPEVAATDPDSERRFLETVQIAPDALSNLASERARNVRAYLLQIGKVEPQRISESARGTGSKASGVHLWLE